MATAVTRSVPDKFELAQQEYFTQPSGFPYEGFELQDVLLPPDDDLGIKSDDDEVPEEALDLESGFGCAVALEGLPVVGKAKYEKLQAVLLNRFAPHGEVKEGCFWMPQGEDGTTKGYAFMEYTKEQEARNACQQMNGYKLDKNHTIKVYMVDDLDRLEEVPDEYEAPKERPFNEKDHAGTMAWLMDKRGRDQFLAQHAQEHEVYWDDGKKGQAELFFKKSFWSDGPLTWSPLGTYVASMHPQGVALWVSKEDAFERIGRFPCKGVQKVDFSAHEELMTCYSVVTARAEPEVLITVFDCRNQRRLRTLQEPLSNLIIGCMEINKRELVVPFLQWSPAVPALAAKLAHDAVQVYNGADMTLLGKQSLKLEAAMDAKWSPAANVLAVYQQEHSNMPARVSLIALPEKRELRQKNLFMVSRAKLYWHPQGWYLAVMVEKSKKGRKATHTSIELFTLKSKGDVTNDMLELPNKNEKVHDIQWEPKGDRFAVLHSEGAPHARSTVSFFTMIDKALKEGARSLGNVTGRQVSELHWSPAGRNILLAGLEGKAGNLEFFNIDDMQTLRTQQHFLCNHVQWDQTGRHVCSWVDASQDMEHGYIIWSFTGEMLYRNRIDNFWNFAWRPRPPSQLPPEKEKEIQKNLKQYAKRFEVQDELLLAAAGTELLQQRQAKRREWEGFLASKESWRQQQAAYMRERLGVEPEVPEFEVIEKEVHQPLDVKEEPYNP